ncbi:glucosidase [Nitrosomonas sp. HPC101]|uniref:MGH1-like glycoside hydrolase domain-containing protein n=1 Tax=Nitrosomonas sp. HPC101 TaxID=1658667 RepID=UPI001367B945|nr:glucosidase [Nitrosomonas sp. HPC101]MXS86143.1 glucosidase [Nitrosomonas sp. HPC101]
MKKEFERIHQCDSSKLPWKKWGPYLSERQWGTVREDYSDNGDAWNHFPHSQSGARAYRWGEDGLAGFSDDRQQLCFALALWNGCDPVLKERLFGVTNPQGNHGEDVKEYYFYLDATPTHSYLQYLYKYPQAAYPYATLVTTNEQRSRQEAEYELLDTGVFDENRYFDIFVEYAKADPEDILIRIKVINRGPEAAALRVLPTLWFRNTWSWMPGSVKPQLRQAADERNCRTIHASHPELGDYQLHCAEASALLFCENETNAWRLFHGNNASRYTKDGINNCVVLGDTESVNPAGHGTKAATDYTLNILPGETRVIRLRLCREHAVASDKIFADFDKQVDQRKKEADQFYLALTEKKLGKEQQRILRQALAGMVWTKQYYEYDVKHWLDEHDPKSTRNREWNHMQCHDILSMPDKWEYPWFAVWDSAFHSLPLAMIDPTFAKQQLSLFLDHRYQHPSGQIPAYEWNFSDVNPPVHAWAVYMVYRICQDYHKRHDLAFLKTAFASLENNFNWWETHREPDKNVYEGGFLGLDNIGVFDRSAALPTGGHLEQSDATAWLTLFSQNMLQIALELSLHEADYEQRVLSYLNRFMATAAAMQDISNEHRDMWDEEDGFFYDVLRFPDGSSTRMKARSLLGLLPLCAVTVIEKTVLDQLPQFAKQFDALVDRRSHLTAHIFCPNKRGIAGRRLLAIMDEDKLRRVLTRLLDEEEFLSPYGIRSLSKYHQEHPYQFHWEGQTFTVAYQPGESDSEMFGGNSNWRGPIWMPMNILIIRALLTLYTYYGENFLIECPARSGVQHNLFQVARMIAGRLLRIFLPDEYGRRPVFGGAEKFQSDPHWRDHLLFYEYFHGEDGSGLGASHQTGWTGTLVTLLMIFGSLEQEDLAEAGMQEIAAVLAGNCGS